MKRSTFELGLTCSPYNNIVRANIKVMRQREKLVKIVFIVYQAV